MRMRRKKNLQPRLARCAAKRPVQPESLRGHWIAELMPDARELYVELGCGKGRFTAQLAEMMPDVLFIGVEVVADAIVVAMERCIELPNVFFISANADSLAQFFGKGEIDRIYLNFSDPWPGKRHAKRRMTHLNFLRSYRSVLRENGEIHFKTDNTELFDFTLSELPKAGFEITSATRNLHSDTEKSNFPAEAFVMTDYESKFAEQGIPICRLTAAMHALPEES